MRLIVRAVLNVSLFFYLCCFFSYIHIYGDSLGRANEFLIFWRETFACFSSPFFTGRPKIRFDRRSADYETNIEVFKDMDLYVPMTRVERNALRSWARKIYDVGTNPWGYTDCDGWPLNRLQA